MTEEQKPATHPAIMALAESVFAAVFSCAHVITSDVVLLRFDESKPRHNAQDQLRQRIEAALSAMATPTAESAEFDDIAGLREMAKHAHRALNAAAGILATIDEDTIGEESVEDVRKRCAEIACSLFSLIRGDTADAFESAPLVNGLTEAETRATASVQGLTAGHAPQETSSPTPTLAYSLDEERYTEDLDDIMSQLDDAGNLVEGVKYSVGEVVKHAASDFTAGCADSILEQARDAAFEAADEWADSFANNVTQAQRDDLERVVGEWADKNLPVTFWTVDRVRQVEVTADDVRDYGSASASDALDAAVKPEGVDRG